MVYLDNITKGSLSKVLGRYGLELNNVADNSDIPYSFWGAPEAGRKNNELFARKDTPLHSLLHETCHYVCMRHSQRTIACHDAAGGVDEENATCYLQIILSDHIPGYSQEQHMKDMDKWGYSFRLGSASAWFKQDASDTKQWLLIHKIISQDSQITWNLRA